MATKFIIVSGPGKFELMEGLFVRHGVRTTHPFKLVLAGGEKREIPFGMQADLRDRGTNRFELQANIGGVASLDDDDSWQLFLKIRKRGNVVALWDFYPELFADTEINWLGIEDVYYNTKTRRGEIICSEGTTTKSQHAWRKEDGFIFFSVTSNGMTGEQWIAHFRRRKWQMGDWAHEALLRVSEAPTNGVTYDILVLPQKRINMNPLLSKEILAIADEKGWRKPHWEVGCLIMNVLTGEQLEEMDLRYIMTMHEPIVDSRGFPRLFTPTRTDGVLWFDAEYDAPDTEWDGSGGHAFVISQTDPQS